MTAKIASIVIVVIAVTLAGVPVITGEVTKPLENTAKIDQLDVPAQNATTDRPIEQVVLQDVTIEAVTVERLQVGNETVENVSLENFTIDRWVLTNFTMERWAVTNATIGMGSENTVRDGVVAQDGENETERDRAGTRLKIRNAAIQRVTVETLTIEELRRHETMMQMHRAMHETMMQMHQDMHEQTTDQQEMPRNETRRGNMTVNTSSTHEMMHQQMMEMHATMHQRMDIPHRNETRAMGNDTRNMAAPITAIENTSIESLHTRSLTVETAIVDDMTMQKTMRETRNKTDGDERTTIEVIVKATETKTDGEQTTTDRED